MILLILAACSGTGKSTLGRLLRERYPRLRLSVSHTTRSPRPGEQEGVDYFYVDRARFEALIAEGGFAEWAEYAGNLYGTAHTTIAAAEAAGHDLLFDVEVVGAANLKRAFPTARSVFLLPPSWAEIERRLRSRGTETEASIERRLATGRRELAVAHTFDFLVINDDLARAVDDLDAIMRAAGQQEASARAVAKQSELAQKPASAAERRGNPPDSLPVSAAEALQSTHLARICTEAGVTPREEPV